jgi:hypothetical protein
MEEPTDSLCFFLLLVTQKFTDCCNVGHISICTSVSCCCACHPTYYHAVHWIAYKNVEKCVTGDCTEYQLN